MGHAPRAPSPPVRLLLGRQRAEHMSLEDWRGHRDGALGKVCGHTRSVTPSEERPWGSSETGAEDTREQAGRSSENTPGRAGGRRDFLRGERIHGTNRHTCPCSAMTASCPAQAHRTRDTGDRERTGPPPGEKSGVGSKGGSASPERPRAAGSARQERALAEYAVTAVPQAT